MTGHATVKLTNGRATERRIDLRADDPAVLTNALPRELTHVVLADLFADKPPPKWALEGMAILAGSPEEISRYTRTLTRCARDSELRPMSALLDLKDFPADKITGFYCQSVSVTEYLIKLSGEHGTSKSSSVTHSGTALPGGGSVSTASTGPRHSAFGSVLPRSSAGRHREWPFGSAPEGRGANGGKVATRTREVTREAQRPRAIQRA